MTEPNLIERERQAVRRLVQLAADRAAAERGVAEALTAGRAAAEAQREEDLRRLAAEFETEQATLTAKAQGAEGEISTRFQADHKATQVDFKETSKKAAADFEGAKKVADTEFSEARWTISTVFEAEKTKLDGKVQEVVEQIAGQIQKVEAFRRNARAELGRWVRPQAAPPVTAVKEPTEPDPAVRLQERVNVAESLLNQAKGLKLLKLLHGNRPVLLLVLFLLVGAAPGAVTGNWLWAGVGAGAAGVLWAVLYGWLYVTARGQVNDLYHPMAAALADADATAKKWKEQAQAYRDRQLAKVKERHDGELKKIEDKYKRILGELTAKRDGALRKAKELHSRRLVELEERRDQELSDAEERYPRLIKESKQGYAHDCAAAEARHKKALADAQARHDADWKAAADAWRSGLEAVRAELTAVGSDSARLYPAWDDPAWFEWKPPTAVPPVARFGEMVVSVNDVPEGVSEDGRLREADPGPMPSPALLPFPDPCVMVVQAKGEGKRKAEEVLQSVMFRLLTAAPPGKVRFTIIDPIGLGHSFSAFMHLADYEEALVNSRIWTEQQQIEQRLADLTAHMEKVIQMFLRNQYATMEEYNAQAGEVAEPYRILVVANFPAHFNAESARRLTSIVTSGARCGVGALITVDSEQTPPLGFNLDDLKRPGVSLVWNDGRFIWQDPDFGRFPFRLDPPLDDLLATRMLNRVGAEAKRLSRVEVPFEFIAPAPETWWTGNSGATFDVPLGRAGATKRQHMQLGKGTSQHVLVAGKTGSGKSTLFHTLITSACLAYSPEELELYLVDFKEGVEFKPYATHGLPHARVVAIESEREFGLSVLQRLEQELRVRGDLFRQKGVQDLAGYRQLPNEPPLPRVLLIVDEFQLFFVEDDKIGQDAALILDRLVRQGRAFGLHVILGSQSLGGAYSLARSTLGQMAVRIALQCSEADAHLILSEENTAARLLSRPGEAVYNDQNGLVEGNDFFQVVWLGDERREAYLNRINGLAEARGYKPPAPQIVFEGKAPADLDKNHLLGRLLAAPEWLPPPRAAQAWLGEAAAIKDPTAAVFRPQSGANLLMVGQLDEPALAVFTSSLLSLSAQYAPANDGAPGGTAFHILDGTPVDAPQAGWFERFAGALPQPTRVVGWRDAGTVLAELAAEVDRRHQAHEGGGSPRFLFIYGLQRFRDLRGGDDDFSYSRRGEEKPASPGKLFLNILRDGPGVGVHTLIWCDSLNNVTRTLDRQAMREFEMRVLFQMSAADSSHLIDSPAAAKLGLHRALYFSEERGQPEKFRPYGLPSEEWLARFRRKLDSRQPPPPAPQPALTEQAAPSP